MRAKSIFSRKAIIFDFDDTLIKDTAKPHLYRDGKFIKAMTADEYHHYIKKPNETFDFTELDNPKNIIASKGPVWNCLVIYDKQNKYDLFILTAREHTAKEAIYDYIVKNGIKNLPLDNIYCIGGPEVDALDIPIKKEEAILKYIKPYFDEIVFYEDNDLTIEQVKIIPGITTIHVR